jgi:hypothetical protein
MKAKSMAPVRSQPGQPFENPTEDVPNKELKSDGIALNAPANTVREYLSYSPQGENKIQVETGNPVFVGLGSYNSGVKKSSSLPAALREFCDKRTGKLRYRVTGTINGRQEKKEFKD